jgi:hypothetical protein
MAKKGVETKKGVLERTTKAAKGGGARAKMTANTTGAGSSSKGDSGLSDRLRHVKEQVS